MPTRQKDPEPVFVNVYGAQEWIPPGWESIPAVLKRFTNTSSDYRLPYRHLPIYQKFSVDFSLLQLLLFLLRCPKMNHYAETSAAGPWHFGVDTDPGLPCLWLIDPDSDPDADPDPPIFVNNLQEAHKKLTCNKTVFLTTFAWWQKDPDPCL